MTRFRLALTLLLVSISTSVRAQNGDAPLKASESKLRAGDFSAALELLEPMLVADDLDASSRQDARDLAARALHARGEVHFRAARIAESIADFERQVQLIPERAAEHWQLGIAYYYAAEYEKGAAQFALHRTVNPQDVENAVWHFLCVARGPEGSLEAARKGLIPVSRDARIPMAQIHQLFAGDMMPDDVLRSGEEAGDAAKFYASLYVGLYFEVIERDKDSRRHMRTAAESPAGKESYMGDVARVHVLLRKEEGSPNSKGR